MASIDSYLTAIKEAVYGEEVRDSIHDAIEAINDEVEESLDTAEGILNQLTEANEDLEEILNTIYNSLGGLTFTVNDDGTVTVDVSES